ncbi:hypothetical protein JG687_00011436 [Phytophthora cactorum]|uniref:Uncharacterized protein n=1 Tax=Phytophthora cactorum TaxID=29920 RepID=A0A8T1U5V8_9STRA|nr:NAD(P)-binding domain [Phytophthora cactorum]KAG6955062.1 hypothetical protein JG687_00011436 [Phytophthora cactorum]
MHIILDFSEGPIAAISASKVDAAFSCQGTTRKDTGSAEAFRKIRRGVEGGRRPLYFCFTSQGANKDSWLLYLQTKGEVEDKIQHMKFQRPSIFRPAAARRLDVEIEKDKLLILFNKYTGMLTLFVDASVPSNGEGCSQGYDIEL